MVAMVVLHVRLRRSELSYWWLARQPQPPFAQLPMKWFAFRTEPLSKHNRVSKTEDSKLQGLPQQHFRELCQDVNVKNPKST
eukprot:853674-Amphidinium_carterae.1